MRVALMFGHVPFWIVTMLAAVWAWSHPRYYTLAQFSFQLRPFSENLLNELHAMIYSVWLLFTPWNQNFDHDLPTFYSPAQWPLPLELLVLSAMTIAAVVARRHTPLVAFGLGWFLLQLVPTSLIPRNDLLSERNLYLPVIGLLLAMVVLGQSVIGRLATLLPRSIFITVGSTCAAIALVFSLSFLTHQRNLLYQDGLLLWSDAVHKSPAKARPHNNLGHAYALYGDWDRAIEEFRTAARLDPDFIVARHNLRDAYLHHVGR